MLPPFLNPRHHSLEKAHDTNGLKRPLSSLGLLLHLLESTSASLPPRRKSAPFTLTLGAAGQKQPPGSLQMSSRAAPKAILPLRSPLALSLPYSPKPSIVLNQKNARLEPSKSIYSLPCLTAACQDHGSFQSCQQNDQFPRNIAANPKLLGARIISKSMAGEFPASEEEDAPASNLKYSGNQRSSLPSQPQSANKAGSARRPPKH